MDGQHRAGGHGLHQSAPLGHQGQSVRERHHSRQVGGHVFADAVADHGLGLHAPAHPHPGEGVLHREEGRLGDRGLVDALRGLGRVLGRGEEHAAEVEAQGGLEPVAALVEVLAEEGLLLVEAPAHAHVLRALAREHEHDPPLGRARVGGEDPLGVEGLQRVSGPGPRLRHHHPAVLEPTAAGEEGVGHVSDALLRVGPQVLDEAQGGGVEGWLGPGRQHQELRGSARPRRRRRGGFLENEVGVRAPHPEGADPRPARRAVALPFREPGVHIERAAREVDLWVWPLEVNERWNLAVLHHERGLHQGRDPRRAVEVPEVRFHGPDRTVSLAGGARAEGPRQGLDLDGIAESGRGSVGLHVADGVRAHLGHRHRLRDGLGLASHARRGVARLLGSVVVDGAATDDSVDDVAVGEGIGEALQHHQPHPVPEDGAGRLRVESAAVSVGREDAAFLIEVAVLRADIDRRRSGEGHVALAVQQALAGQVDGDEGSRAERLDGHRRPREVELVGDDGGQGVAVVEHAERGQPLARGSHRLGVLEQVHREVAAHGRAGEHADAPGILGGVVARSLEGRPGAVQEEADLRIHPLRLAGVEAEEPGVEQVDVLEERGGLHVSDPVLHHRGLGVEERDRLHAVPHVLPITVQGGRSGDANLHPDDGHVVEVVVLVHAHAIHLEGSSAGSGSASRWRRRRCISSKRVPARSSTSSRTTGLSSGFSPRARARRPTVGAS